MKVTKINKKTGTIHVEHVKPDVVWNTGDNPIFITVWKDGIWSDYPQRTDYLIDKGQGIDLNLVGLERKKNK